MTEEPNGETSRFDAATLANMRSRVERCRRLARGCTDDEVAKALLAMADEGEADIARMLSATRDAT